MPFLQILSHNLSETAGWIIFTCMQCDGIWKDSCNFCHVIEVRSPGVIFENRVFCFLSSLTQEISRISSWQVPNVYPAIHQCQHLFFKLLSINSSLVLCHLQSFAMYGTKPMLEIKYGWLRCSSYPNEQAWLIWKCVLYLDSNTELINCLTHTNITPYLHYLHAA